MTLTRRQLLWPFRRDHAAELTPAPPPAPAPEPAPPAFSLSSFYAARSAAPAPIPRFAVAPVAAAVPDGMVPRVRPHACIAPTSFCSVCVERCPVPGALQMRGPRPEVNEAACTGCGQCIARCPAPILGFELVARSQPR